MSGAVSVGLTVGEASAGDARLGWSGGASRRVKSHGGLIGEAAGAGAGSSGDGSPRVAKASGRLAKLGEQVGVALGGRGCPGGRASSLRDATCGPRSRTRA